MALARVVTFSGVSSDRMAELEREIREGKRPDNLPATELVVLHDAAAEQALVIMFFDNEADYEAADEVLNAMPADETPGRRASVAKFDVGLRMTV